MNILIIEDSRLFQKMLMAHLNELGCVVSCVRSNEEALEALRSEDHSPYDLIIASQMIIEELDNDFVQYHKSLKTAPPIILMIAEPDDTLMTNAKAAGIKEIFPKTNLTYLKSSIRYYIQGRETFDFHGGKVLYVEDSPSVAHIVIGYLNKMNLEITHYESAEEAFQSFIENDYDLVITDIMLRGTMDGLSLVRMIRALNTKIAYTPILAMTGNNDTQLKIDLLHAGVNDYVNKPPVEKELAARVNNLITNKLLVDHVRNQQRSLYQVAMTDQLTTCHNRHSLAEYATRYIKDSIRYQYPLCVAIIDLDRFKQINDEFGQSNGDLVLSEVGKLLMANCRQGDIVARTSGKEFLILIPHCNLRDAAHKAEDIRSMIELCQPEGIQVTASIGVAGLIDKHNEQFDQLYQAADNAVTLSKKNGRNQVTIDIESAAMAKAH